MLRLAYTPYTPAGLIAALPFRARRVFLRGAATSHLSAPTDTTTTTTTTILPIPYVLSALAKAVCTGSRRARSCIVAGGPADATGMPAPPMSTLLGPQPPAPVTVSSSLADSCAHGDACILTTCGWCGIFGGRAAHTAAAAVHCTPLPAMLFNNPGLPWCSQHTSRRNHLSSTRGFATASTPKKKKGQRPYRTSKWHVVSNKNIVVSQTPNEIFEELEVSRRKGIMPSPINISTALTRLLKLTGGEKQATMLRNPDFALLILEANVLMRDQIACKEINTQTLANMAYAVAKLHRPLKGGQQGAANPNPNLNPNGVSSSGAGDAGSGRTVPDADGGAGLLKGIAADLVGLLDGIEAVVLSNRNEDKFQPKELANLMWAFAKCNHGSHDFYMVAAQRALNNARQLEDYKARDLASLVWAFGKAKVHEPALFAAVEVEIANRRGANIVFGQDIANIVAGFAAVQHPAPLLYRLLQTQMLENGGVVLGDFEAVTVVVVAEAFVSAHQGSERLFCALLQRASDIGYQEFTAGHMAQLARSVVHAAPHAEDTSLALEAMRIEVERRPVPKALSPDHLMLLAAFKSVGMGPPKTLVGLAPASGIAEEQAAVLNLKGGEENENASSVPPKPQWNRIRLNVDAIGAASGRGAVRTPPRTRARTPPQPPAPPPCDTLASSSSSASSSPSIVKADAGHGSTSAAAEDDGVEPKMLSTTEAPTAVVDASGEAKEQPIEHFNSQERPKHRASDGPKPKRRPRSERRLYQVQQVAAGKMPRNGRNGLAKGVQPNVSRSSKQQGKLEQQLRKLEGIITRRDGIRPTIVMEQMKEPAGGHTMRVMVNGVQVAQASSKKRDKARLDAVNNALNSSLKSN